MSRTVKVTPILFSGLMIRALLEGRKTQTRRILQLPRWADTNSQVEIDASGRPSIISASTGCMAEIPCRYGQSDLLWVRETFQPLCADGVTEDNWPEASNYKTGQGFKVSYPATDGRVEFYDMATDNAFCSRITSPIHMPRWASRLTLRITDVRVQRLQDISEKDALAEGLIVENFRWRDCEYPLPDIAYRTHSTSEHRWSCPMQAYQDLWEFINGKDSWKENPWVWALSFEVIKANINVMLARSAVPEAIA